MVCSGRGNDYISPLTAMTSQKHRQFCMEPMGDKTVYNVPGIGRALGGRLQGRGISHARDIEGHFLVFNQNQEMFGNWLKDTCGANAKQQRDCYNGLKEWTRNNM
uniref:Barrier-to-autointegration factor-like protein n=1 Tax=Cyprinus carpio TaxID=7962 RepID=A0A8C1T744_CYPCA